VASDPRHICNDNIENIEKERTFDMSDFILELWNFMKDRKKFWLLPIVIVLIALSALIVLASGSAAAPFIYTLF
jgi:hypothetical protein